MSRDVFLSILSLDSHNRGYGQSLLLYPDDEIFGQIEVVSAIGTASITSQTGVAQGDPSVTARFYSIA